MKNNTIIEVMPQGFCGGMMKAIKIAKEVRTEHPDQKITILGNLVHNRYVKLALRHWNIETVEETGKTRLELLDRIDEGIVIFTAHGVHPDVYKKAEEKGLRVYDASCRFVVQTQRIVQEKLEEGAVVFYIGKNKHPEAESIYTLSSRVYLIETEADIPELDAPSIFVTNQTTMSTLDIEHLFDAIRRRYPSACFHNEICNATRVRQEAVLALQNQEVDVLIVVGDPTSNNTEQLAQIARLAQIPTVVKAETVEDLRAFDWNGKTIAVTSGASTPKYLTSQIIRFVQDGTLEPFEIERVL